VAKKQKARTPTAPLTGKHKSYLRSLAHPLKPVVRIGHQGLTAGVLSALDVALERHELIKVKVAGDSEVDADELGPEIEKRTGCRLAQIIGHTLVLYRRRQQDPKIALPRAKPAKPQSKAASRAHDVAEEPEADDDDDDEEHDEEDELE
jgi:RNA-binding protein